jgi:60 kDa SS-A/Ro ribonucleoprotein
VVIPSLTKTTPAVWEQLLYNAPYMNLLRNLQTFTRHGVFAQEANVRYAVERLTDPTAIKRARVLPFRFYTAWQQYRCGDNPDSRLADALREALELSFCNMPTLGTHRVCIGTDVSGSMSGCVSEKSATRYIDVAGVFTGALLKRCQDRVIPLPFDTGVHSDCGLSARDDILVTADKIARFCGGGTAVGAPVQYLLDREIPVDAFIGITDNVDWAYGAGYGCRGSFLDLWRDYREKVAPQAQAFLVTIAPYGELVAPAGEPGVHFIYGWSAEVLRYIALQLESGASQVRVVSEMKLGTVGDAGTHDESATDAQMETEDS